MKRQIILVFIALCIGGAVATITVLKIRKVEAECKMRFQYECPLRLQDIRLSVLVKRSENGVFPADLNFILEQNAPREWQRRLRVYLLLCPAVEKQQDVSFELEAKDYNYINWSNYYGTNMPPDDFPLVFDSTLSNHNGNGIYVIMINGKVIWDSGAAWLKQFLKSHPEITNVNLD